MRNRSAELRPLPQWPQGRRVGQLQRLVNEITGRDQALETVW